MNNTPFGWCFIGSGSIAHRVQKDFAYLENAAILSVYSSTFEHARQFAGIAQAKAYRTLEEAVLAPGVDAVYVATPHAAHMDCAIAALQLGKPVLCEKPFAINGRQSQRMIEAARASGQYLMEGMWMRFNPCIIKALEWIQAGRIGKIVGLDAAFSGRLDDSWPDRMTNLSVGGGGLLDLGVYALALSQILFGGKPDAIDASATFLPTGADAQCAMALRYGEDALARLYSGLMYTVPNDALIYGERGHIRIPSFAMPNTLELHPDKGDPEVFDAKKQGEGFQYEFAAAMADIRAGRMENGWISHRYTMDVMETMDAIRKRVGLVYPQDAE